jgi:broad specificity phosphatase PhoE
MRSRWPRTLWIVRHGQSAGNLARDRARAEKLGRIDIGQCDVEVPLSALGEEQSRALGCWFAALPAGERPQVILSSPYVRARETARIVHEVAGLPAQVAIVVDERLREREFGILDRLTHRGIEAFFPDQARARRLVGKFYHRPPGGESWCDVILRLRSALDTLSLRHGQKRVLVIAHQVVVLCLRYLLENLDEARILAIDAKGDVANCAVTQYEAAGGAGAMRLIRYNFVAPLREAGAAVTRAPDANLAPR